MVESAPVYNAFYNPAFVLMQYFGYLRRNPDDAPDFNFDGYDFWLGKLNQFSLPGEDVRNESVALGRVRHAEMVRAFIESAEYRKRFFGAEGGNQLGPAISKGEFWSFRKESEKSVTRKDGAGKPRLGRAVPAGGGGGRAGVPAGRFVHEEFPAGGKAAREPAAGAGQDGAGQTARARGEHKAGQDAA